MSIRTNPTKAVTSLLKRLKTMEEHENLKELKSVLTNMEDLFSKVKKNKEELLDLLTILDGYLRNSNISELKKDKEDICQKIKSSIDKLRPKIDKEGAEPSSKPNDDVKDKGRVEGAPYFTQPEEFEEFQVHRILGIYPTHCLLSLLLFPKNVVIKKRHIIYWWIALGSSENSWPKTEKEGEDMFDYLLHLKLILPHGSGNSPVVNKFRINHWIHQDLVESLLENKEQFCGIYSQIKASSDYDRIYSQLKASSDDDKIYSQIKASSHYDTKHACLALDEKTAILSGEFGFNSDHWGAIFNVNASHLSFEAQWMAKMKNLKMFHLGRWQDSASHHIEVNSQDFLEELKDQKHLKYLSLRGISRISKLPPSIFQLESLEILDLKACHNLETLPNDISAMIKLKHLDVSQCFLLESMPKGIEKLIELQVLKGFIIGSSRKNSCRISDLAKLKKLEQLSIGIGSESVAVIQDDQFENLKELLALKHLKISWAVSDPIYGNDIKINFPSRLEKLHLEGFPGKKVPEWLKPSNLPKGFKKEIEGWLKPIRHSRGLKELNLKGGKLKSLDHGEDHSQWCVEILHLKHLKNLKIDLTKLQELFPSLRYAEIKESPHCPQWPN